MSYIEREKALNDFDEWIDTTGALPKGTSYYYECRACIEDVPSADVVEVVRCEKCQHRDKNGLCQAEGQKLTIAKDNHFCSKGEKRTISDEALSPETKQAILDDFMKGME